MRRTILIAVLLLNGCAVAAVDEGVDELEVRLPPALPIMREPTLPLGTNEIVGGRCRGVGHLSGEIACPYGGVCSGVPANDGSPGGTLVCARNGGPGTCGVLSCGANCYCVSAEQSICACHALC